MPFIGSNLHGGIYPGGSSYYTTSYINTTTANWYIPARPNSRPEYTTDASGNKTYYNARGEIHREREPAIINTNGDRWWYQNNLEHREDGPSFDAINGFRHWKQRGKFHRVNGPAVDYGTHKEWWLNGKRHREDGPAVEISSMIREYWYLGRRLPVTSTDEAVRYIYADKYL